MTLTPREYLHQHFGPKDRKWIESLSDNRCWAVSWDLVQLGASGVHGMRQIGGERPTYEILVPEELHPLPEPPSVDLDLIGPFAPTSHLVERTLTKEQIYCGEFPGWR